MDKRSQEYDISSKSGDADTELMPLKAMWKPTVVCPMKFTPLKTDSFFKWRLESHFLSGSLQW